MRKDVSVLTCTEWKDWRPDFPVNLNNVSTVFVVMPFLSTCFSFPITKYEQHYCFVGHLLTQ